MESFLSTLNASTTPSSATARTLICHHADQRCVDQNHAQADDFLAGVVAFSFAACGSALPFTVINRTGRMHLGPKAQQKRCDFWLSHVSTLLWRAPRIAS